MSAEAIETYKQLLQYRRGRRIPPEAVPEEYFRLHLFERGSDDLELNGRFYSVLSPSLLCLSERDQAKFASDDARLHEIRFKPILINASFDLKTLRGNEDELRETQGLDIYWLYPFLREHGLRLIGPSTAGRLLELIESMARELEEQKGDFWPCRSRSFFYDILNIVAHIHAEPERIEARSTDESQGETRNIIAYLNANYHHKITMGDLTDFFSSNRTTLTEKFRESMGMTPMNYLTDIRIRMACLLLRDTTLPVQEIMERVGYEDTTHFGRTFRGRTNLTPSKYREEYRA